MEVCYDVAIVWLDPIGRVCRGMVAQQDTNPRLSRHDRSRVGFRALLP